MQRNATATENTPTVSIIIVNWNSEELLGKCLKAVFESTEGLDIEVIVVDNASSDSSVEMIDSVFPAVKVIQLGENLGFARANNIGLKDSHGEFILLLNPDAFLHNNAVEIMVKHMQTHPRVGACGPRLLYEDGQIQRSCSSFPTLRTELWQALWLDKLFPRSRVFGEYQMTYWDLDDLREVDCVMGACMLIRRDALGELGLLDERFFMYSEEVDLCFRMKQSGWKVIFVPMASATHIWRGSAQGVPHERTFLRLYGSRVKFFRKHYGKTVTLIYKAEILLQVMLRVVGGGVTGWIVRNAELERKTRNYRALLQQLPSL
jgi:GT2 family glycosyltransferase